MNVELFGVVSRGKFVLPTECPHCKAPFTGEDSQLKEWFVEESGWHAAIKGTKVESTSDSDGRCLFAPVAYWCSGCDRELDLEPVKSKKRTNKAADKVWRRCIDAAESHGQESEPDHEVGDLQDHLRAALNTMTPAQLKRFAEGPSVLETISSGE